MLNVTETNFVVFDFGSVGPSASSEGSCSTGLLGVHIVCEITSGITETGICLILLSDGTVEEECT